jgi:hypothetical protein
MWPTMAREGRKTPLPPPVARIVIRHCQGPEKGLSNCQSSSGNSKPWIFNVVQRNDHAKKSGLMTAGMGVRYDAALRIQAERHAICYPQVSPVAKSFASTRAKP